MMRRLALPALTAALLLSACATTPPPQPAPKPTPAPASKPASMRLEPTGFGQVPGWPGAESRGPWYFLGLATRAAAFVWGASEAFVWWRRLRRRLPLGLADAVVTNRVLLWGASELVTALGFGVFAAATLAHTGVNAAPVVLAIAACGLGAAGTMTLAIFPPARYLRWVGASAASGSRCDP